MDLNTLVFSLFDLFGIIVNRLGVISRLVDNNVNPLDAPGSKKHEFACISMAAVHIDTSSVRVRVTCEFHSYEQFLCRSCFIQPVRSEQHKNCINFIYTGHDAYLTSQILNVNLLIIRGA